MSYWERLGYEWGRVAVDGDTFACRTGGFTGEITVLLPEAGAMNFESHIAVTRTAKLVGTGEIIKGQVFMTPYAGKKLLVLEHELGHALGWRHHGSRYHIMHPEWDNIGHASRGLEHRKYLEEMERIRAPGRN
jgi:hypothetical protein